MGCGFIGITILYEIWRLHAPRAHLNKEKKYIYHNNNAKDKTRFVISKKGEARFVKARKRVQ